MIFFFVDLFWSLLNFIDVYDERFMFCIRLRCGFCFRIMIEIVSELSNCSCEGSNGGCIRGDLE